MDKIAKEKLISRLSDLLWKLEEVLVQYNHCDDKVDEDSGTEEEMLYGLLDLQEDAAYRAYDLHQDPYVEMMGVRRRIIELFKSKVV